MLRPIPPRVGAAKACADQLRDAIVRGELEVGSRLPPERSLAETLGVNRATVRIALHELEASGLVSARQGSGYAVLDFQDQGGPDLLGPVAEVARETGKLPEVASDLLLVRRELARAVLGRLTGRTLSREALAQLEERTAAFEALAVKAAASASGALIDDLAVADFAILACILDAIESPVLRLFLNPAIAVLARIPELAQAMYAQPLENAAAWRAVTTLVASNLVDANAIVSALEHQDNELIRRLVSPAATGAS